MGISHLTSEVVYIREDCRYGKHGDYPVQYDSGGLRLMTAEAFTGKFKKDEGKPPGKARAAERVPHPDSGPDED